MCTYNLLSKDTVLAYNAWVRFQVFSGGVSFSHSLMISGLSRLGSAINGSCGRRRIMIMSSFCSTRLKISLISSSSLIAPPLAFVIELFSLHPASELDLNLLRSHNSWRSYGNNRIDSSSYDYMTYNCTFESMLLLRSTTAPRSHYT